MEQLLRGLLEKVPGALAILVNDKDGVLLAQASSSFDVDPWLSTTFVNALEQANKLQLGEPQSITSEFDNATVVHFNMMPLIVTFCMRPDANIGLVYAVFPKLRSCLEPIRIKLESRF
ncbi:Roadblock/LAMTOR2 domain-containing protein [Plasmodiophora brassicae]|uniref:Roadblock/LAMTOR2 domain-containing protein n=1 Tax=Plasmodiophora brassicae TaxID=37360 RepID=A0A0G4IL99_PLABS|nr:hypothetical protein PBRA_004638 [Plasmodiophora brassicae]SPQ93502.1 unnamed protein product [Plasmodiophora brassicae]